MYPTAERSLSCSLCVPERESRCKSLASGREGAEPVLSRVGATFV